MKQALKSARNLYMPQTIQNKEIEGGVISAPTGSGNFVREKQKEMGVKSKVYIEYVAGYLDCFLGSVFFL